MIQQVVLNFGPPAASGAPSARVNVRHRFNMGNEEFQERRKMGLQGSDPVRIARQLLVVARCGKHSLIEERVA